MSTWRSENAGWAPGMAKPGWGGAHVVAGVRRVRASRNEFTCGSTTRTTVVAQASAFGTEAGAVTHCTAAGIALATAGCMTGENRARIHQLPDTTGMKSAVVLQRGHSIDYGAPLRQSIALTGRPGRGNR